VSLSPDFSKKDINKNIELLISEGYEVVSNASNGDSWESVISLLDEFEFRFERECSVNSHLNSVMFDEKFNQEYEKTLPKISKFYSNISTNKELFKAYKRVLDTDLTQQQTHIVNEAIKGFQLSGIDLDADSQEEFKKIQERLTVLSNTFSNNSLMSTNEWKKSVSKADLPGYTEDQLSKIRKEDGSLEINLQMPVYLDLMTFCENQTLREEVYKAYISRASEIGLTSKKYDNTKVMDEILKLRLKLANLLGFNNYAELSIASKMVESPNQVIDFLDLLINKSQSQALTEFQELESFAGCKINPWDFAFYSEKLKEKKYGFKKSDLTPYFPEEYVLNGLFSLIKELYEISLKEVKEDSYHNDVKVFDLVKNNETIGRVYIDLYARENKRGGAWMSDYQPLTEKNKPVAFVVCNLNKPTKDKPAMFEFDEIVTIFHEFGHALHHLLTKVEYPCAAGISGVPWDGVELPSQYMEFFVYDKEVVKKISSHYQTGESLPNELYQKIIDSKNFQSAIQMLRQCEFALWDIKTHMSSKDTYEILNEVRQKTSIIPAIDENRFLNTFGHIFSGGYAAGYFSYKWAEVLAADAFFYINQNGSINKNLINSFKVNILEVGGSLDFMSQYKKFRGGEPELKSLLVSNGIQ